MILRRGPSDRKPSTAGGSSQAHEPSPDPKPTHLGACVTARSIETQTTPAFSVASLSTRQLGELGERIASGFLTEVFPGVAFFQPDTSGHFVDLIGVSESNEVLVFEVKTTRKNGSRFRTSGRSTAHGRQMTRAWVDADRNLREAGFGDADVVCYGVWVDLAANRVTLLRRDSSDARTWRVEVVREIAASYWPWESGWPAPATL